MTTSGGDDDGVDVANHAPVNPPKWRDRHASTGEPLPSFRSTIDDAAVGKRAPILDRKQFRR